MSVTLCGVFRKHKHTQNDERLKAEPEHSRLSGYAMLRTKG